jgi:hypothetical protein
MAHPICHKVISVLFQTNMGAQNPVYNGVACFEKLSNEHRLQTRNSFCQQNQVLQSFFTKLAGTENSNNKLKTESQKLTLERAGKPV